MSTEFVPLTGGNLECIETARQGLFPRGPVMADELYVPDLYAEIFGALADFAAGDPSSAHFFWVIQSCFDNGQIIPVETPDPRLN